ncbi:hypothetical protein SMIR_05120 [Streptomyces mirabilis]|uniref:hypothetical protein n=1 Tax=Streptomyces mirabilis TaxID=68239 RepID=UPI001BAE5A12|nr:hypothetical protein [Streptomyces mirabilis]QUW78583.1 hypothetical protein SMIR_05120 [Streptomyces mirabilis]
MLWLDDYERRARLAPGLLALLPVSVALAVLGLSKAPVVVSVLTALSLAGGPIVLAELVRHQGRKVQETLWASWGGSPTIQKLRLRQQGQNSLQRETWRQAVSSVAGIELSSARSERTNTAKADEAIEVAIGQIRSITRDETKFPLVRAENRSYGFHRNLYGIRWAGRITALLVVLGILGYMLWLANVEHQPALTLVNALALLAAVACLAIWWILPSPVRMKDAAERYAYELLQAAVVLNAEKGETTPEGSQ